MRKVYFVFDNIGPALEAINSGKCPNYYIYGGWHLQKEGLAEVIDTKVAKDIRDATVVINVPKYAPALKKNGNRVILINLNSNHILNRNPNRVMKYLLRKIYNACDVIMCLDKSQIKPLKKLGVKSRCAVNPLFVDTTDFNLAAGRMDFWIKNYKPYYLSSGFDTGRNFSIFTQIKSYTPIVILGKFNAVPYLRYCELLYASKGVTLNINNQSGSSDLSGGTTVFESLCAHKPVFINPQTWLSNFPSKNVYIYKTKEELEELLNKNIEWIEEDEDFTFEQFLVKLKKILKINQ